MIDDKNQAIPQQELDATTESLNALDAAAPAPEAPKEIKEQPKIEPAHWKKMREEKERAERERDELLKLVSSGNAQRPAPQEEEVRYNPDDLVEWKVLDKKMKQYEARLQDYERRTNEQLLETRIKSQYSDFEKVASDENIAILRHEYPEIAATLASSPDMYSKAVSAYTLIKKLGIHRDDTFIADKARAQANSAKPKPASLIQPSVGSSALGEASSYNGKLTKEQKDKLYSEMKAKSTNSYF